MVSVKEELSGAPNRTNGGSCPKAAITEVSNMPSNKALQTDKGKLSRLSHSQESRQLAFAAELGC